MVPKDHGRIGSLWRSDSRDGQISERGPHTHCHRRRTQLTPKQLVDAFEFCCTMPRRHRADFKEALSTLRSVKNEEESSLLPKLVAKLFLVLVAMARFLVTSLIWDITATMDFTLMERGNVPKQWMVYIYSWKLIWCRSYSDQFGNSQQQVQLHEQTRARCTSLEQEHKRTTCHTLWCRVTCTSWFQSESRHLSSMYMCVSPWVHLSLLLLRPVLPCLLLFLPPSAFRAAHWVRQPDRQPDRHAKLAQLREQGEWRRLRRPHLPHNIDGPRDLSDPWTGFNQLTLLELTRKQVIFQARAIYGQNFGRKEKEMPSWRRSRSGLMRRSILIMHENCKGLFHRPGGQGSQGDHQECSQEIGNTNCSYYALQI